MTKTKLLVFLFFSVLLSFSTETFAQPTITQQPTNQTVAVGQTAFFSLAASSANPISYQWYKNGAIISGATTNNYTTPPTTLSDNGTIYYCIVSDSTGSVESNNATLLVGEPPVITQHPENVTVTEGDPASFSITVTGTAPLQYQWRKNGVDVPGANTSNYNIGVTVLSENGDVYTCVVSNSYGIVLSNNATLTVNAGEPPLISQQPEDQSTFNGETVTFTLVASGTSPLSYQWYKNNVSIAGANSSSYTTPAVILADNEATFYCVITNNFGTLNSDTVSLFVTDGSSRVTSGLKLLYEFDDASGDVISDISGVSPAEDIIIRTPEKVAWTPYGLETFKDVQTRREDKSSKLINAVESTNEITLEAWFKPEFSPQPNGRIFTFSVSGNFRNLSLIQNSTSYEVRIRTSNTDANGLPAFRSSSGVASDQLVHFVYTKDESGTAKIYLNGVLDTTMTNAGDLIDVWSPDHWLAIGSEPLGGAYWRGVHYLTAVYNRALTAFEVNHNYNIATPFDEKPFFTIHPKDQYILEGESLFLDSYAVSILPISYQWRKNGIEIPGETNSQLNLANIGYLDNGATFECRATSSGGVTYSETAFVYVTALDERSNNGIQAFYTFREGTGNVVNDVSSVGAPLNLNIYSEDAVEWDNNGLRINTAPSIITTNSASKITSPLKESNELTVEAWVSSASVTQSSPARIFTISADGNNRNLSLGQNNDSYEINLRTTGTDVNGSPAVSSSSGTVSASGFDHVVFTRSSDGTAKFFINGTERVSTTVSGDFSNWNDVYLFSLGNEFGVDHHWEGLVNLLAIFDRPLSNSEVLRNFNFGPYGVVNAPSNVTLIANEVGQITISWSDNSGNEDGFIIERGVGDPVVYTEIGSVGMDSTVFTDASVVDNTIYHYRVKSFYSLGESDYTEPLAVKSLITPIDAPTGLEYTLDSDGYPILTWEDNSDLETNFVIERRLSGVGSSFTAIDTVNENVTSYKDLNVTANTTYIYRVFAFNQDTASALSGETFVEVLTDVNDQNIVPTEYSLNQNYPNPFNPSTTIKFGLPENSNVSLVLYNMLGQQIMKLADKAFSAGYHNVEVNGSNLTSGIYIYSISAEGEKGDIFKETKKMILLK